MASSKSYERMRIIVLGASGQIGSVIHNGLLKTHEVIGTSRKPSPTFKQFDPSHDSWSALGKAEVLINCVGQIDATRSSSFHRIHVDMTKRIVESRQILGNPRIIQISALGASADHKVEFLRTKGLADDLLLQHPNTTVVRPSIVCTHGTIIVKKMLMLANIGRFSFGLLPVPKGFLQTRIQPILAQDLVDLVSVLCDDPTQRIVNAVGPDPITFEKIIGLLIETRGQKLRTIEVPRAITDLIVKHFVSKALPMFFNLNKQIPPLAYPFTTKGSRCVGNNDFTTSGFTL